MYALTGNGGVELVGVVAMGVGKSISSAFVLTEAQANR